MKIIKNRIIAILLIGCAVFWLGCKPDKPGDRKNNRNNTDSLLDKGPLFSLSMEGGDTAIYEMKELFKASADTATPKSEGVTKILLSYPKFKKTPMEQLADSLNGLIQKMLLLDAAGELAFKSVQARMDDFISDFLEDQEFSAGMGWGGGVWENQVAINVVLNSPDFLVLRLYEMNFTGGAHANYRIMYLNFDMNTGKKLTLDDLFVEDYEIPLLSVAERSFRKKAKIKANVPLIETDFEFEGGVFSLPKNFALTRTGFLFFYNAYELPPYQNFEFELPYDEVIDYIDRAMLR